MHANVGKQKLANNIIKYARLKNEKLKIWQICDLESDENHQSQHPLQFVARIPVENLEDGGDGDGEHGDGDDGDGDAGGCGDDGNGDLESECDAATCCKSPLSPH